MSSRTDRIWLSRSQAMEVLSCYYQTSRGRSGRPSRPSCDGLQANGPRAANPSKRATCLHLGWLIQDVTVAIIAAFPPVVRIAMAELGWIDSGHAASGLFRTRKRIATTRHVLVTLIRAAASSHHHHQSKDFVAPLLGLWLSFSWGVAEGACRRNGT